MDVGDDQGADWGSEMESRRQFEQIERAKSDTARGVKVVGWCLILLSLGVFFSSMAKGAIFTNGFERAEDGGAPVDYCVDALVNPGGMQRQDRSWTQTFSAPDGHPSAIYSNGVSFPTPVGANVGIYEVVPFTPFTAHTVNLYFDQVQARPQDGYGRAKPARTMMLAITPCFLQFGQITVGSGDLRAPVTGHPDPFHRPGCRKIENSASLIWTTDPLAATVTDDQVCVLTAGRPHYLVIAAVDPTDGIDIGEETCLLPDAVGCDVGVVLSSSNAPAKANYWIMRAAFKLPPED